jgi:hypothetical protein
MSQSLSGPGEYRSSFQTISQIFLVATKLSKRRYLVRGTCGLKVYQPHLYVPLHVVVIPIVSILRLLRMALDGLSMGVHPVLLDLIFHVAKVSTAVCCYHFGSHNIHIVY